MTFFPGKDPAPGDASACDAIELMIVPPLWGRAGVGGGAIGDDGASPHAPTPDPSPQGGGEK
jgi:hypothetical protein